MFKRIKNIIVSPKSEWDVIESENAPHLTVLVKYVLPLSLITLVSAFTGYGIYFLISHNHMPFGWVVGHAIGWGIRQAIIQWAIMVIGIYALAFIINVFAKFFDAEKNFNKSFSLVAYAYTPLLLGGIFYILPIVFWMAFIPGIYSLYLIYSGLQPITKAPDSKKAAYFFASIGTMAIAVATIWFITWLFLVIRSYILYGTYYYGF